MDKERPEAEEQSGDLQKAAKTIRGDRAVCMHVNKRESMLAKVAEVLGGRRV
jgi:hypothetical protein